MKPLVGALGHGAAHRIEEHPFWYHTIDVAPAVTTAGWFDLRHALPLLPFPDVEGRRCLDIGTFDGFYAFEMERRGAAEVVAIDIEDHEDWDWPPDARAGGPEAIRDAGFQGPPKGAGFRLLAELIGSSVKWRALSIYDLDPADTGPFDVVVCGSLLLHLRDPIRALEAVRAVCRGQFLSVEQIELWLTLLGRGRPLYKLNGSGRFCQWWLANGAGHERMLYAAGFEIVQRSPFFINRFNVHPKPALTLREVANRSARRLVAGTWDQGVFHRGLLARTRV